MLMLLSLIARGVSLELIDQHDGWHPFWGRLFGLGSLFGVLQGAAFGGLIAGLPVRGGQFAGGPFTFLHDGYAVLTGLTAVILYLLAGCSFVWFKSDGDTRRYAGRVGRRIVVALAVFTVASWLLAPVVGLLRLQPLASTAADLDCRRVRAYCGHGGSVRAFASTDTAAVRAGARSGDAAIYAGGLLIAGGLLYPTLVPPHITVHGAASPHTSLLFLTIGAASASR